MKKKRILKILSVALGLMTLSIIGVAIWAFQLQSEIKDRLAKGWFLPPVEIYTAPQTLEVGLIISNSQLKQLMSELNFRWREPQQSLLNGDWTLLNAASCQVSYPQILSSVKQPVSDESEEIGPCALINPTNDERQELLVVFSQFNKVMAIVDIGLQQKLSKLSFDPILFAQYYNDKPILRRVIDVGQAPLVCLQAVTAIEDADFLEHSGVSVTGTLRAVVKNVSKGRFAEGGSTITQQLVKNYFLTPEKTIKRKLKEQLMAVLLEAQVDKDTILENYLNVIYMGANGPFQVRGMAAAADHYLAKPLEQLDLEDCALLAAIINNPGRYNPFRHPENAQKRRKLVLEKMLELQMIDASTLEQANSQPLPQKPPRVLSEPAPYFVQAVNRRIDALELTRENGLKIYTTMNFQAQEIAQTMIAEHVNTLEEWYASLKKHKQNKKQLQAALISIDVSTANVLAIVGGRSFKNTQYNRVIDARRQVGSIMKPFVYLTALENYQSNGEPYSPVTVIKDQSFEYKYEGQSWSPKNYDGTFHGEVPLFYALKSSLNAATAQLGLDVGLTSVVDVAKRFGIESPIKALPSLTLGAFEMSPWEIARAYTGIANFGKLKELSLIHKITSSDVNETLYANDFQTSDVSSPENVAALIGMLKQTLISGTARASQKMGFNMIGAGKTGTTSDTKDAWFAGFTPKVLTIVWVGYDDNTPIGLTGASGALPMWVKFMKEYATRYSNQDFAWPEGTYPVTLNARELGRLMPTEEIEGDAKVELILRSKDENTFD